MRLLCKTQFIFLLIVLILNSSGCSSGASDAELAQDTSVDLLAIEGTGGAIDPSGIEGTGGASNDVGVIDIPPEPADPISGDSGPVDVEIIGDVDLGPIIGSSIAIYDINDLKTPVCKTTTNEIEIFDGEIIDLYKAKSLVKEIYDRAGKFTIPAGCIHKDRLYLVEAKGGFDLDIDDDQVLNWIDFNEIVNSARRQNITDKNKPTPIEGRVRALVLGEQMLEGDWKVSALTEIVFEAMQLSTINQESGTEVLNMLDALAPLLLTPDSNGNKPTAIDIVQWDPKLKSAGNRKLLISDQELIQLLTSVHAGQNTTANSIAGYEGLISHLDTLAPAQQVIIDNGYAYIVVPSALIVVDVTDPKRPSRIGFYPTGKITELAVDNNLLFISRGTNGLLVLDATDPSLLREISTHPELANATSLKAKSGILFALSESLDKKLVYLNALSISDNFQTVHRLEIAKSQNPSLKTPAANCVQSEVHAGQRLGPSSGYALQISGDTAYVSTNLGKLHIVDISDYTALEEVNVIDWSGYYESHITNSFYADQRNPVCGLDNLLEYLTVVKPVVDFLSTYLWGNYKFEGMKVDDNKLFAPVKNTEPLEYAVFDLSDPTNPERLSTNLNTQCSSSAIGSIKFTDEHVVIECKGFFTLYDKENLKAVEYKDLFMFRGFVKWMYDSLVVVGGDYTTGFASRDLTKLAFDAFMLLFTPNIVTGEIWGEMDISNYDIKDDKVYLATGNHGLQIVNFAKPKKF